jgi:hypothetical protein
MAKFTNLSGIPDIIEFKGGVPREVVEATSDTAVDLVLKKVRPIANEHYQNAIREVGRKLNGLGMPQNLHSSGSRSLSIGTAGGDISTIRTKPWKRLDWRKEKDSGEAGVYELRPPLSLWFWQKHGMEGAAGSLSEAYNKEVVGKGVVRVTEKKATRNHHKGRINTRVFFEFKPLPAPFETMITHAFAQAEEKVPMQGREFFSSRKGLARARWAEDRKVGRPFIRRVSAYLGKSMRTDVIEKLRKL